MGLNLLLFSIGLVISLPVISQGIEIGEKISVSGTVTSVYQWIDMKKGFLDEEKRLKRVDRGSAVIDLKGSIKPFDSGELIFRLSLAKCNGLKRVSPFVLPPNADDLSDDLKNINGHRRDYLLELSYAHKFKLNNNTNLKLQAGIIDSTAFIDDNSYANSEIEQFMNPALVNNPIGNRPTYDLGAVIELESDRFNLRILGMHSKNDIRRYFNLLVGQVSYKIETSFGEGNYRVYAYTTDKRFSGWDNKIDRAIRGIGVSFDQELIKETFGAFFRAAIQDSKVNTDYSGMVSLGFNLSGRVWGRKDDEIGVGYAYLKSGSQNPELKESHVFESYIKFRLLNYRKLSLDFTVDYQHLRDSKKIPFETISGDIFGFRLNFNF